MLLPPVHCTPVPRQARRSGARRGRHRRSGGAPQGAGATARRERLGVHADEHVPARGDGVDPLGLLAQGQARHAPQVGLALHSAGVGGDHLRAALELEHARVGDRVDEIDVARHRQLPRRQRGAGAGVHAGRPRARASAPGSPARAAGGRGRRCCSCGARWRAGTRPRPARRSARQRSSVSHRGSPVTSTRPATPSAMRLSRAPGVGARAGRRAGRSRSGCPPRACRRGRSAAPPRRARAGRRRRRRRGRRRAWRWCRRGRPRRRGARSR